MLEEGGERLGKLMRWRKELWKRWFTLDRLALLVLLGAWWFLLQRDVKVVDAVDTVSYLAAVYSVWRSLGSLARAARSALLVRRRRGEVSEGGEHAAVTADLVGHPPEGVTKGGVVGGEESRDG
jgi:hypothetical protein